MKSFFFQMDFLCNFTVQAYRLLIFVNFVFYFEIKIRKIPMDDPEVTVYESIAPLIPSIIGISFAFHAISLILSWEYFDTSGSSHSHKQKRISVYMNVIIVILIEIAYPYDVIIKVEKNLKSVCMIKNNT